MIMKWFRNVSGKYFLSGRKAAYYYDLGLDKHLKEFRKYNTTKALP